MKKKRTLLTILMMLMGVLGFSVIVITNNKVFADASDASIEKSKKTILKKCYNGGYIKDKIENFSDPLRFSDQIMSSSKFYIANLVNPNDSVTCEELLTGDKGILKEHGISDSYATGISKDKQTFVEGMGYVATGNTNKKECVVVKFKKYNGTSTVSGDINDYILEEGPDNIWQSPTVCSDWVITQNTGQQVGSLYMTSEGDSIKVTAGYTFADLSSNPIKMGEGSFEVKKGSSFNDFVTNLKAKFSENNHKYICASGTCKIVYKYDDVDQWDNSSGEEAKYAITSMSNAGNKAVDYIYGDDKETTFSKKERLEYYIGGIKKYFFDGVGESNYWICNITDWSTYGEPNYQKIYIDSTGVKTEAISCAIKTTMAANYVQIGGFVVNNISTDYQLFDVEGSTRLDLSATIKAINDLVGEPDGKIPTDDNAPGATPVEDSSDDNNSDTGANTNDESELCYKGAGALGWVMCPVIGSLGSLTEHLYDFAEKEFLQVKPGYLGDATREAWGKIRDIANIAFVVLLMVVIFSQVTGYGIDNYGIKKTLPRLIIAALLVNISFFICQLAVDTTNIIGSSLRGMVENFGSTVQIANDYKSEVGMVWNVPIIGGAAAGAALLYANPAIILTFLVSLLSAALSLLFLLIILVVRQMGVVLLVIIAPLALVAYLLPNTSSYLKKWGDAFKTLLIAYPVCAILVGVGSLMSKLTLATSQSALMSIIALLVRILPFFAIPPVIRKSLSAFDNLGTTISNFGNRAGQGLAGSIRNSDGYRNLQQAGLERRSRLKAGIDRNGNELTGVRGVLSGKAWTRRGRAAARSEYLKNRETQQNIDQMNDMDFIRGRMTEQDIKADAQRNETALLNDPNYARGMKNQQQLDLEDKQAKMAQLASTNYVNASREQQRLKRRAEQNEISLLNSSDHLRAMEVNQDSQLLKKQTEAQASALSVGKFRTADGQEIGTSNIEAMQNALIAELASPNRNDAKAQALYDAIRGKGDDGIDALANVLDGKRTTTTKNDDGTKSITVDKITFDQGALESSGFKQMLSNIANDGEIKNKSRSLHSTAGALQDGEQYKSGMVEEARNTGQYIGKMKSETWGNMTDGERAGAVTSLKSALAKDSSARTEEERNLIMSAYNASTSSAITNKMKGGELEALYDAQDTYIQENPLEAKAGKYTTSAGANVELTRGSQGELNVYNPSTGQRTTITSEQFKAMGLKRNRG